MPSRYARWMYDWEHRLTSVDNNRVVRPLEWGVEWARDWPCRNGFRPGQTPGSAQDNPEKFILDYNRRIVAASDEFYSYTRPTDFRLETREVQVFSTREVPDPKLEAKVKGTFAEFLRFTSPVQTPFPENNLVNARWFPARGRRAIVLLPHWNADAIAYVTRPGRADIHARSPTNRLESLEHGDIGCVVAWAPLLVGCHASFPLWCCIPYILAIKVGGPTPRVPENAGES